MATFSFGDRIIATPNSEIGATVAKKAEAQGIPVIDYDRLNLGGSSKYYVSFDNEKVGELQGQGLVEGLAALAPGKKPAEVIEIEGAPTDNNATLFYNGQQKVLKPKYESGDLKLVQSQPIDNWDNQKGGTTFEQILTGNGQKVDGVVAANDGLAGAIITVLKKYGLNGKVPVTGQDATVEGLQNVLAGTQCMTVYKSAKQEAGALAELAIGLTKGEKGETNGTSTDPEGKRDVPLHLFDVFDTLQASRAARGRPPPVRGRLGLHRARAPWGLSVYDLQARLLGVHQGLEDLRYREGLDGLIGLHQDAAVLIRQIQQKDGVSQAMRRRSSTSSRSAELRATSTSCSIMSDAACRVS
mgnify:CR=1 FL=1